MAPCFLPAADSAVTARLVIPGAGQFSSLQASCRLELFPGFLVQAHLCGCLRRAKRSARPAAPLARVRHRCTNKIRSFPVGGPSRGPQCVKRECGHAIWTAARAKRFRFRSELASCRYVRVRSFAPARQAAAPVRAKARQRLLTSEFGRLSSQCRTRGSRAGRSCSRRSTRNTSADSTFSP